MLLSQTATAEQDGQDGQGRAGRVAVRHVHGNAYAITVRGHQVLTDQPAADGGSDGLVQH
jgi:hypothetical protein